jgi:hypothetical protein
MTALARESPSAGEGVEDQTEESGPGTRPVQTREQEKRRQPCIVVAAALFLAGSDI